MRRRLLVESAITQIKIVSRPGRFGKKPLFLIFRRAILKALHMLPLSVIELPRKFVVFAGSEERHLKNFDSDGYVSVADGQVEKDNITISLRSSFYNQNCRNRSYLYEVIWHEIAHVYHYYLKNKGAGIDCDWRRVAGNVYNYKWEKWRYVLKKKTCWRNRYPADGLISEYSTSNIGEDIADFFAEIYRWIGGISSIFDKPDFLITDARYIEKIKLLYEYKFITAGTYRALTNLYARAMRRQSA